MKRERRGERGKKRESGLRQFLITGSAFFSLMKKGKERWRILLCAGGVATLPIANGGKKERGKKGLVHDVPGAKFRPRRAA